MSRLLLATTNPGKQRELRRLLAALPAPVVGPEEIGLALDVQAAMQDGDWLVIDGGNTHFWSEISVNIAGWHGLRLGNILHPGTFSMLGVGVPFASALSAAD